MTNIQDDQLISQYSDDSASAVSDEPALNNDEVAQPEQPIASNDEVAKPQPSRADVDELISQLDALHQEISAKTVASAPVKEENEVEKLAAPPVTPMIESSDDPQLPPAQTSDADLDKFIEDLEAKIANNKQEEEQKPAFAEEKPPTQPEPTGKTKIPYLQPIAVKENFSHQRPSLDLSKLNQDTQPDLTLNNGQLEEQAPLAQPEPAITTPAPETPNLSPEEVVDAEDLESQNIFEMLNLDHLEQSEKEAFLDDLEKLIWDNFIEVELAQLLNPEEKAQAEQILADSTKGDDERKEALLIYLEKFIPNLEEIMYKKALLLKKEMFEERIRKSRQQASEDNNLSLMADLDQIQELIKADRYKTAIALLNKN